MPEESYPLTEKEQVNGVMITSYMIKITDRGDGWITVAVHGELGGGAWLSEVTGHTTNVEERNALIVQAVQEAFE
jgi:hypothetical protein